MKKVIFIIMLVTVWMTSCKSGFDNIEEFASSETIYPGKFDTIALLDTTGSN